jgi:hypothetical protein
LDLCVPECSVDGKRVPMIPCGLCDRWFHPECLGLPKGSPAHCIRGLYFCQHCLTDLRELRRLTRPQRHLEARVQALEATLDALDTEHALLRARLDLLGAASHDLVARLASGRVVNGAYAAVLRDNAELKRQWADVLNTSGHPTDTVRQMNVDQQRPNVRNASTLHVQSVPTGSAVYSTVNASESTGSAAITAGRAVDTGGNAVRTTVSAVQTVNALESTGSVVIKTGRAIGMSCSAVRTTGSAVQTANALESIGSAVIKTGRTVDTSGNTTGSALYTTKDAANTVIVAGPERHRRKNKMPGDQPLPVRRKFVLTCSGSNEQPLDDSFLYCADCDRQHLGDCPVHGPAKLILDCCVRN